MRDIPDKNGTVEMPMGMAMLMAQNPEAMSAFCNMSADARARIIERAKTAGSSAEMQGIVSGIAGGLGITGLK